MIYLRIYMDNYIFFYRPESQQIKAQPFIIQTLKCSAHPFNYRLLL